MLTVMQVLVNIALFVRVSGFLYTNKQSSVRFANIGTVIARETEFGNNLFVHLNMSEA